MAKYIKLILTIMCIVFTSHLNVNATEQVNSTNNPELLFDIEGTLAVGEVVTLNLTMQGIEGLYGASLDFQFDDSQIEILELTGGNLLSNQSITPVNKVDQGTASIVTTELGDNFSNLSNGVLFKIKLKILKEGTLAFIPTSNDDDYKMGNANILVKLSSKAALPIKFNCQEVIYVVEENNPLILSDIKLDMESPQPVGSTITITPEISGGIGEIQYKYWIHMDGEWLVVKDFSTEGSYKWTPTKAGVYGLWVDVQDSTGTIHSKEMTYVIEGWYANANEWYYMNHDGQNYVGWLPEGSAWYYLKPSGVMATGWEQVNGTWYYFDGSGVMQTGWLQEGSTWYYLKPSGAMATGWQQINGIWYYFYASGIMATNTEIDGWKITENGEAYLIN